MNDSYVVLVFEPTMTLTRVIPTTLLFENSDSRTLTDHYLDNKTQQLIYSLHSIVVLCKVLWRASRAIQLSEESLYNS